MKRVGTQGMTAKSLYLVAPETVECRERPEPDPTPETVVVETEFSAISPGTELLVWKGQTPPSLDADGPVEEVTEEFSFPLRYGYAVAGTVVAVGRNVDESWLHRRVFAYNPHESHFRTEPSELVGVPETIPPRHAPLLANAETAVNFLLDGGPLLGERVAVFGQGVVGLLTTGILASMGLGQVVAVDPVQKRRDLAAAFGADRTLDPGAVDLPAVLDERVDLSYELSGNPGALDDAVEVTAFDGTVVVGSWYGTKPVEIDLGARFHRNRISIESSQVSTVSPEHSERWTRERRRETAWEWLADLPVASLLTHETAVDRANEAYRRLDREPGEAVQILLTYPGTATT